MALTDIAVKNAKPQEKRYKLFDVDGLYLIVSPAGGKWWRFKYRFDGKEKQLSLGTYPLIGLREARKRRDAARESVAMGIDPGEQRKDAQKEAEVLRKEAENTFEAVALEWYASYAPSLTERHAVKLMRYLRNDIFPRIGNKAVAELEPGDILPCARPAEARGNVDTAHRLIRLVSQVLGHALITGRSRYNAAAGLSKALRPNRPQSYPAVTEPEAIGHLLRDIENYDGFPSIRMFLRILPYVFTRPSELRLAQWTEINFKDSIWRIPATRMKMRREHAVPLARQVVSLLEELQDYAQGSKFLFPSARAKTDTISDAGPLAALRLLGYSKEQMTLHGFRAMASTRLNEMGFRADVIEAQLAHKEQDAVRLAYNRAQYMDERRNMMQEWAEYLDGLRR